TRPPRPVWVPPRARIPPRGRSRRPRTDVIEDRVREDDRGRREHESPPRKNGRRAIMHAFRIGKLLGLEIRIDWSWVFIFVLLTWNLSSIFSRWHPDWSPAETFSVALVASLVTAGVSLAHADTALNGYARLGPLETLLAWLGPINLTIGAFNLIPAFPLDGGRVLRSILWGIGDDL